MAKFLVLLIAAAFAAVVGFFVYLAFVL